MKLTLSFLTILLMLFGLSTSLEAQTVKIGTTSYNTIADAITAAASGDVIDITGIHTETITINDKNLTIQGTDPTKDIIQAAASAGTATNRVITIAGASTINFTITIKNLGIRYGKASANGGGINIDKNTGLTTLENLIIEQNSTTTNGGGIGIAGSSVNINNCTISNNSATTAGGGLIIAANNAITGDREVVIKGSLINSNTAANGGGIYVNGNRDATTLNGSSHNISVTVENTFISNNSATSGSSAAGGGAIWVLNSNLTGTSNSNTSLKLVHVTTYLNSHTGAAARHGLSFTTPTAIPAIFANFSAYNSILIVENSLDNKAINFGGTGSFGVNTTAIKNCIIGGTNGTLPTIISSDSVANKITIGRRATYAGIGTTLVDKGGKVKVLPLSSTSTNSLDYCTVATGITLPTTDARGITRDATPDAGAFEYAKTTISGPTTLSADATYDELVVASGGSFTIASGVTARVNDKVDNSGTLTVNSGGSLVILGTATGNATVKRNTKGSLGYSIVGAPVSGANLSSLNADFLYTFDGTSWTTPTGTMTSGKGYFAAYSSASPEVSLSGAMVAGNQSIALHNSGNKFNIVANPYAAAISMKSFLENSTNSANTTGAIYLWDDGGSNVGSNRGGDYIVINNLGATVSTTDLSDGVAGGKGSSRAGNGYIGSMQGFLVEAKATGNIDFTSSMQVVTASANADANYYRKGSETPNQIVKLSIAGNDLRNELIVGLVDGATFGKDYGLDATKFIGQNQNIAFYSILGGDKMAIQGLPKVSEGENRIINLGLNTQIAGTYTLRVEQFEGFEDADLEVELQDLATGKSYMLKSGVSITVEVNAQNLSTSDRFRLSVKSGSILSSGVLKESKIQVFGTTNQLEIRYASTVKEPVAIYNLQGQVIFLENVDFQNNMAVIRPELFKNQIYILRVNNQSIKFLLN